MDIERPDTSLPRRQFFKEAAGGFVVLTVLVSGCGSSSDGGGGGDNCDGVERGSTSSQGHSHTMCVPRVDLNSPPASGATYDTSVSDSHAHLVTLTQADLTTIAGGGRVTVTSSNSGGHTHDFTLFM